jgi:hypothetical protein
VLRNNGSNFGRVTFLGGALYANGFPRVAARQRLIENFSGFGQQTSMPQGYQSATKALIPTLKESWDMFVMFRGDGSFAVAALTVEDMTVGFSGEGTFSPNAQHAYTMTVEFLGEGTLSLTAEQLEQASVAFDSGTRPSAFDIAQEVWQAQAASYNTAGSMGEKVNSSSWNEVIESGYTAAEVMRILAAVAVGKTTITDLGGGNATVAFRDQADTKNRILADMTGSERTDITLDPS